MDGFLHLGMNEANEEDEVEEGMLRKMGITPLEALPLTLFKLTGLTGLRLKQNMIEDLSGIGSLRALKELDVSENRLSVLPDELCLLASLESLDISENSIKLLPEDFGKLGALETLVCFKNVLTKLPDSIGNCEALAEVGCTVY
jgi:Leucine-rich repeat (LRR) protein